MSKLPSSNKIKEFFKNLFAALFVILIIMIIGYFGGKEIEDWKDMDSQEKEWLEDMQRLEERLKRLEEQKTSSIEPTVEIKPAVMTNEDIIAKVCKENNVPVEDCLRVAWNESRYQNVRGTIDSRDRGVYQINSFYHPEIKDDCAFNVECSTLFFIKEYKSNRAHITWAKTF